MKRLRAFASALISIFRGLGQFHGNVCKYVPAMARFLRDFFLYRKNNGNDHYVLSSRFFYPCLRDRTAFTPVEPTYFFQDVWAAGKIAGIKPAHHYDVGSSITTMGIISQVIPTTVVDIRPVEVQLQNFTFMKGSILSLPFEDNSIESLSSLCVVEHVGLGRYGDPIDPWGSEKAVKELKRVLKPGGDLLFSVPVDRENRIYFNAHRAFTREYIMDLFRDLIPVEERYIYGRSMQDSYDKEKGFGTGLYHFRKR